MPVKVNTKNGKEFRRCGIMFGPNPIEVADAKLNEKFCSPANERNLRVAPKVIDVLRSDPNLFVARDGEHLGPTDGTSQPSGKTEDAKAGGKGSK